MALTDLQRRTLANLSIPRNPDDLAAHLRSHAPASPEQLDAMLRGELTSNGWVVNLGQHSDPAALAALVQAHESAMELPDEKARNYALMMKRPELAWQLGGDLWMLTNEGLAQLHAPTPVNRDPLTPSEIQDVVNAEWARTLHGVRTDTYTAEHGPIAHRLLEDEFAAWYTAVADECERAWNVRPSAPIAGGASGWTLAYESSILDQENQKTAIGAVVDPWFMALSILAFTSADTGTTADNGSHIPTYTGYARKSVAGSDMAAAGGTGSAKNVNAITFAACTAGTSTVVAMGNCVASTVGVLRKWGDVASTVISTTQTPPTFAVNAYTTTAT